MSERIGVLLMAYGGPASLEDLPGYLADVRRGRPTPHAIVKELERNYASIGGRSPLPTLTQRQADALSRSRADRQRQLDRRADRLQRVSAEAAVIS